MTRPAKIKTIKARQILDSRNKKTLEVELKTDLGKFRASCPSGTSKGKYESWAAPVEKAVKNIKKIIAPAFLGKSVLDQKKVDKLLNKKLGANTTLAVSTAVLRAGAAEKKLPLFKYIRRVANNTYTTIVTNTLSLPKPCVLLVEGGLHGKSGLDIQEFMVIPPGKTFREQFSTGKRIYEKLKKILIKKFGKRGAAIGLEGAFTPPISDPRQVLDLIMEAAAGYNVEIGLDCAISHTKKGKYSTAFYKKLARDYPILFLEDPFGEEEWRKWQAINSKFQIPNSKQISSFAKRSARGDETKSQRPPNSKFQIPNRVLIVGDDLTVTNPGRIKKAHREKACNAAVIKPNQIGTVTEAIEAAMLAKSYGWKIIVSHRSGETKDDFIADFAVGIGADFIKAGAPSKAERMAKYNRLLKIEREINSATKF